MPMPREIDLETVSILLRTLCVTTFLAGITAAAGCAGPSGNGVAWEQAEVAALVDHAWRLADEGREDEALEQAHAVGARAEVLGETLTAARAHLLVARLEGDLDRARYAYGVLVASGDAVQCVQGAREMAALADARGETALALEAFDEALAHAASITDHGARGRALAPLHAERARMLAGEGRPDAALGAFRQARLALTLVPDDELLALRVEVLEALAAHARARGEHDEAFALGARAAQYAAEAQHPRDEIRLLAAQADDLLALGRTQAAADRIERAFTRADEVDDPELRDAVARRGLAILATLGEDGSARHSAYSAALVEAP